ncbi:MULTISPECIES: LytR/AlgR family response regulator transcription factor [Microbulbifer]|uniref:LytR/AlgR family response regulator transcription factor n=1 Tax=Microbulbifer TaxID=48073 RepID=UPI001CD24C65|nr:LytTR family DNA-binding domain-containing protein [Microbulbifer agarilyticus]MCA0900259.1 LytTR family DNA-binding domain-containing protein [Microbulbifer agarilyticus]
MAQSKLNTLLVDDEPLALEGLRLRLSQIDQVEIIGECSSGEEAIELNNMLKPDLIFLDMEMPGINGLEVVEELRTCSDPIIIFVTAYDKYAVDAFELNADDYLVKPASLGRLKQAIDRAQQRHVPLANDGCQEKLMAALHDVSGISMPELEEWLDSDVPLPSGYPDKLEIKNSDNETVMVPTGSIDWIDAAGDYMCIHAAGETHILRITLKKLQQLLNPKLFFRIHKSTIVNAERVSKIIPLRNTECILVLDGDIQLKASRNFKDQVHALRSRQATHA